MSETQFTPAPWLRIGSEIVEAERQHIRICFLPSDWREYASGPANAHLIAAAPELFEALATALCPHPANGAPDRLTTEDCLARGECGCDQGAAIRKARSVAPEMP
jgi:hypothetical protein